MSLFNFIPPMSSNVEGMSYDSPTGVEGFGSSRKRRNPFGEDYTRSHRKTKLDDAYPSYSPQTKILEEDESNLAPIFRKRITFPLVASANVREPPTVSDKSQCWVCSTGSAHGPCTYCERAICNSCIRQCNSCQASFCSFCTTVK